MSEVAQLNISNLLNQVSIIKKKYDDLATYTGENYNIFEILRVKNDEFSHSQIIGNLLNPKGKHGQKDIFLKLFLEELPFFDKNSEHNNLIKNFQTQNSKVVIEKHISKINEDKSEGGRIDILLEDGVGNIVIENKIYAKDQYNQLLRYYKPNKNAPILYLTLDGKEPSKDSKQSLEHGVDFICISYRKEIKNWIEKCIIEMVNKPFIRETLNQYLHTIDSLTNQIFLNKNKMEITEVIRKNLRASHLIINNFDSAKKEIMVNFWHRCFESLKNELIGWEIENKPDYIKMLHYILLYKLGNNRAYFYCRYNSNNGEIFFGITPNKEYFHQLNDKKKLSLISNYKAGGLSIRWENYNKISLNDIDVLSEINEGDYSYENEIVIKMKCYIVEHEAFYNDILNKLE